MDMEFATHIFNHNAFTRCIVYNEMNRRWSGGVKFLQDDVRNDDSFDRSLNLIDSLEIPQNPRAYFPWGYCFLGIRMAKRHIFSKAWKEEHTHRQSHFIKTIKNDR